MDERWTALHTIASRQDGIASHAQLRGLGFSAGQIRRLRERGVLQGRDTRVLGLAVPDRPGHRAQLREAQLSILRPSFAAAYSALRLHGLGRRDPEQPWLVVEGKWAPQRPGVRVITSRSLPPEDLTRVDGMPSTTVARALCDVAGRMPWSHLRGLLLDARQRGWTDESEVGAIAERRRGARGRDKLLVICSQVSPERADSELEHLVRRELRSSGFPPPAPKPVIIRTPNGPRQLDVAWPELLVGIDCDGRAYHGSRAAHDADSVRRSSIQLTDYRTIYVTWHRVEEDWAGIHRDLSLAFALQARGRS